jgi:dipeptidyl aminopeptidase/acylaminoacyl peptidase
MRTLLLSILLILSVATPTLAEKRAFTIKDLYEIKKVVDPQYSPDGKRIAFSATTYDLEKGKSNADIWLVNADGSGLRKITESENSDTHPRWSPDGKSLLFVSSRENGNQVWRLPVDGGEAVQVTDFSMAVTDPEWLSDGRRIVFFTEVFPECGADDECNKNLADNMKDGAIQAHMADDLLFRHWTFWKDGKRFHLLVYDTESEKYADLTAGDMDAPAYVTGDTAGFDVSPDGAELCVSATADKRQWETTNKDLWIVPTSGGKLVNITSENKGADMSPQYSPDGRYIAYTTQATPDYESDLFVLAIYDCRTREKRKLTATFDNWVDDFHWAPDSKTIVFKADVEGSQPLYKVDIKSAKISKVVDFKTLDGFDISPNGKSIIVARRSIGEPGEIWTASSSGKSAKRLTTLNKAVEDAVDIRPPEVMWIDSPTGRKIQTFVVKPHNFDPNKTYPMILNVHGGPQSQWTDGFRGDWQVYAGAGYVTVFPNPHGSTGFGQEFTREISRDWGGKVYQDVMAVADALAAEPWVDENRMGAMGWSYGGYMMMWLEGHTDRFKVIAAMMGVYDLTSMWGSTEELWFPQFDLGGVPWESEDYKKWSPHRYAANFKTPCLVITGEKDYRVPYTQSLEFFTTLRKLDVPARLIVFKNDGHWPSWVKSMPLYYNAHLEWFHKYLGGGSAPYDTKEMVRNRAFKSDNKDK